MITSITAKDQQANKTISSLNSEVSTLDSQISSLNTQISTDMSQMISLQNQVADLQAISSLQSKQTVVSSKSVTDLGETNVTTFTADYAGYVLVTVSAASDYANEGTGVYLVFASSVQGHYSAMVIPAKGYFEGFSGVPDALPLPVVPGTVTVYLDSVDSTAQTATVTVVYFY